MHCPSIVRDTANVMKFTSKANALLNTTSLMISTSVAFRRATDQGTLFIILYNEPLADSEETTVQLQIANANARPLVHI